MHQHSKRIRTCPREEFRHLLWFRGYTCAAEHLISQYPAWFHWASCKFSPASCVTHALPKVCKVLENRYGEIVILASILGYNFCTLKSAGRLLHCLFWHCSGGLVHAMQSSLRLVHGVLWHWTLTVNKLQEHVRFLVFCRVVWDGVVIGLLLASLCRKVVKGDPVSLCPVWGAGRGGWVQCWCWGLMYNISVV